MDPSPQALIEHAAFARALAHSLLNDVHAAEDVVQDAWVAALVRPPAASAPPRAWLTRVVQRFAWRRGRSSERRRSREALAARPEALSAVDDDLARAETLRRVTDAVLALEEPYRSTVLLRFYEGLDASAIAHRTRTPEATVRSRLQRALGQLRERLDREHGGDRSAWSAGLAALVGRNTTTSVVGGGLLAMGTMTKAIGAAAAVVALMLAWRTWQADEQAPRSALALATAELVSPDEGETSPAELVSATGVGQRTALPPSSVAATAHGALEVHVTWERDGLPAADEELRLIVWRHATGDRLRRAFTDADGRCRIEGLLPGHVSIGSARGAEGSVEVVACETAAVELAIPRGFTARGRVVDPEGAPVAGARLWLSQYFNYNDGTTVATTHADGTFELVDVPEARYLGAIADGYAPSHLELLVEHQAADPLQDVELTLALNGPGGALDLRILDADGALISGAYAHVTGQRLPARRVGNRYLQNVPTFDAWSDEQGLASIDGLQPGEATLTIYASGMAVWNGMATVEADRRTALAVVLARESVVTGTVRDAAGEPVANASVYLAAGEYDPLRPSARTGADGSYALGGLAGGEVSLKAGESALGSASTVVHLEPSGVATWDPVLSSGRVLSGRVVDDQGAPLAGWTVQAMIGTHSSWRAQAETDADGAFRMVDVKSEPLILDLYHDVFAERFPTLQRNVDVDESEVVFQVGRDDLCTVTVTGRILDPERRPIPSANVALWPLGSWYGSGAESDVRGEFRAEHLRPGTYEVSLGFPELPSLFFGRITLAPEEVRALGEIVLQPPGTVHITIEGAELAGRGEFASFSFQQLDDEGHSHWSASATAAEALAGVALQPGHYALLASGRTGIASVSRPFELAAGDTVTVDLVPRPGRHVYASIEVPSGTAIPDWVQSSVRDGAGELIAESLGRASTDRRQTHYLQLVPGTYELEAEASDGRRVHEFFEVTLDGAPQPLEWTWSLR